MIKSQLPDADMQAAPAALERAFHRAREVARLTGTPLLVEIDGVFEEVDADDPRLDRSTPAETQDRIHDR